MPRLEFHQNPEMSLGVEIEIQLIDPISCDLKSVAPSLLEKLSGVSGAQHIKSEIFQSMLEIDTPISKDAHEAGRSLRASLRLVRGAAAAEDADVLMAGTHPFAHYADRLLTPQGRYFKLVDRNQWITRRLQIFGLHVHLGMKNGDHALAMNNALCHYLPVVLALSASSPYWHREDTGLASSRITFFEAIPTGGHPYLLNSWREFEELIERLVRSQSISSIKDLWWDIRPNLEYGTIEVRIADCPPTIREVEAIVALLHSLAKFIDLELAAGKSFGAPPEWILRENKWRASRHGVQCQLIADASGVSMPFAEVWRGLTESLQPLVNEFDYRGQFDFLSELILKGPSYSRQRGSFTGDFESVVRHLIRENESDAPEWGAV